MSPGNEQRPGVGTGASSKAIAGSDTPSLFDSSLSGINRALANSDSWQRDGFNRALRHRIARGGSFTIEEIVEDCGLPVDHHNRVGAWTNAAARAGLIRRIGYTKARRASRAGGVVAVWVGGDDR